MTDKIIIDGVDVSGCEYFVEGVCTCEKLDYGTCKGNSCCYYKQLQRKEQELKTAKEAYEVCLVNKENRHKKEIRHYKQALEKIKETATDLRTRRDYHSPDEVNADIDKILTIVNEVLKNE